MASDSSAKHTSCQRDGSFSDVLADDEHPLHPTTAFVYPGDEEAADEEEAKRVLTAAAVLDWILDGGNARPDVAYMRMLAASFHLSRETLGATMQVELLDAAGVKHKQSVQRYTRDFSECFKFKNPLCRSAKAVESFKRREAVKRAARKAGAA